MLHRAKLRVYVQYDSHEYVSNLSIFVHSGVFLHAWMIFRQTERICVALPSAVEELFHSDLLFSCQSCIHCISKRIGEDSKRREKIVGKKKGRKSIDMRYRNSVPKSSHENDRVRKADFVRDDVRGERNRERLQFRGWRS